MKESDDTAHEADGKGGVLGGLCAWLEEWVPLKSESGSPVCSADSSKGV